VLFVEAYGRSWVLDNKFSAPVPAAEVVARCRVIWSVNRDGAVLAASSDAGQGQLGCALRCAAGGCCCGRAPYAASRSSRRVCGATRLSSHGQCRSRLADWGRANARLAAGN